MRVLRLGACRHFWLKIFWGCLRRHLWTLWSVELSACVAYLWLECALLHLFAGLLLICHFFHLLSLLVCGFHVISLFWFALLNAWWYIDWLHCWWWLLLLHDLLVEFCNIVEELLLFRIQLLELWHTRVHLRMRFGYNMIWLINGLPPEVLRSSRDVDLLWLCSWVI